MIVVHPVIGIKLIYEYKVQGVKCSRRGAENISGVKGRVPKLPTTDREKSYT